MSADSDVLDATVQTLKIFDNTNYFRSKANVSFSVKDLESNLELLNSSLTSDSHNFFSSQETSDYEKSNFDDHKVNCMEFKTTLEKVILVYEMYKHHLQETKKFQKEGNISWIQDYYADIIDSSNVSKKIDQIQSVLDHIKTVAAEGTKLKQVLRSSVLNDVWKIYKDYHKAVVNFVKEASMLASGIEGFVHSLESSKTYNPEKTVIFKNKEIKVSAELNENMDLLRDLQNYLQEYINSCKTAKESDTL